MAINKRKFSMNDLLKLSASIAILLIGFSVTYYVFIYIPKAASNANETARKQEAYNECKQMYDKDQQGFQKLLTSCLNTPDYYKCLSGLPSDYLYNMQHPDSFINSCIPGRLKVLP